MKHYSKNLQINSLLNKREHELHKAGFIPVLKKELPYGTQFAIDGVDEKGLINLFYSAKKGVSLVDCSKNSTSEQVLLILNGGDAHSKSAIKHSLSAIENGMKRWIGTDESGKGDFFGPLVVAGFLADKDVEKRLKELGVDDSKKINDSNIQSIAIKLRSEFPDRCEIITISNPRYNELYTKFANLNKLLGWAHGRVIQNLAESWSGKTHIDGVVIDQFGSAETMKKSLRGKITFPIVQRPRAESNSAVAAASILARHAFVYKMRLLSKDIGVDLPLGAGAHVKKRAAKIFMSSGISVLNDIVKRHFKTYREVVG